MSERTRFTAYITKYALTQGIQEVEVEDCFNTSPMMVRDPAQRFWCTFHKPDWHLNPTEAEARAESMRQAKIASLKRQIVKLDERIKF